MWTKINVTFLNKSTKPWRIVRVIAIITDFCIIITSNSVAGTCNGDNLSLSTVYAKSIVSAYGNTKPLL